MLTISVFHPPNTRMLNVCSLRTLLTYVSKTAKTIGINVNARKFKLLRKNTRVCDSVMIDRKYSEDAEEFTYLGINVTTTGDCRREINSRISKAIQAFAILQPVWNATNLSVHNKNYAFIGNMLSVLLFGVECRNTTVTIQRK